MGKKAKAKRKIGKKKQPNKKEQVIGAIHSSGSVSSPGDESTDEGAVEQQGKGGEINSEVAAPFDISTVPFAPNSLLDPQVDPLRKEEIAVPAPEAQHAAKDDSVFPLQKGLLGSHSKTKGEEDSSRPGQQEALAPDDSLFGSGDGGLFPPLSPLRKESIPVAADTLQEQGDTSGVASSQSSNKGDAASSVKEETLDVPPAVSKIENEYQALISRAIEEQWSIKLYDDYESRLSVLKELAPLFYPDLDAASSLEVIEGKSGTFSELNAEALNNLSDYLAKVRLKQNFGIKPLSDTYKQYFSPEQRTAALQSAQSTPVTTGRWNVGLFGGTVNAAGTEGSWERRLQEMARFAREAIQDCVVRNPTPSAQ